WKSYDFKSSAGLGNLFIYPLGPRFDGNPYERHAFKHDGGEMIFNLPNGLQGYMLADGKETRIDAGPIAVVSDNGKVSGTPESISAIAKYYQARELTSVDVAGELGLDDKGKIEGAVAANDRLKEIGLFPLAGGKTVKREVWENTEFLLSPYQEAAAQLKLGT